MSFSSFSSVQIIQLVQLVREKEVIEKQIALINGTLDAMDTEDGAKNKIVASKRGKHRGASLKDSILTELKKAGKKGISAKELAVALKVNPGSVGVWLYTTGKTVPGLKKVSAGRFVIQP